MKRLRERLQGRSLRGEAGAAAVEFALLASILFILIFGIIDFGFALHSWNDTSNAAREGARRAIVDPNPVEIIDRVREVAGSLDQSKLSVSIQCSVDDGATFGTCGGGSSWVEGDIVRVRVDYAYSLITPIGSLIPGVGPVMNVHSVSESRFEGQ